MRHNNNLYDFIPFKDMNGVYLNTDGTIASIMINGYETEPEDWGMIRYHPGVEEAMGEQGSNAAEIMHEDHEEERWRYESKS